MGIHGLMSYVGEHKEFFVDLQLRNTKIIIDGSNLFHRLYFDSDLDMRRGGDYDSFTDIVHKFFETLALCNIQPYVVLDGGRDMWDKKLTTIKERMQDKIRSAYSLSRGGGGSVLPLLTRDVFKQSLIQLQVPFVQCFSEADRSIVSLANQLNCPVLTTDSDFCIFDLSAGYCPLNYFQWRNICTGKDSKDCYIPARCFLLERFCRHFSNMNKTLLPLFAVVNGNDYISLPAMERFFSKVRLPVGRSSLTGRKQVRIQGLLNWLSHFADPAEAVDNILQYLQMHEKEKVRQILCSAMEEYEPSKVNLEDFFLNGVYEPEEAKKLELPQWILTALAKGLLAPFVSDALVLKRTFLHVQVENMQRHSAHATALPIRQTIYRLLNTPQNSLSASLSEPPVSSIFHESDRTQVVLKTSPVHAAALPQNMCSDQYSLSTLNEVPFADRRTLLLETLEVTASVLEPAPSLLWLPIAVTCYWTRHSEPKVKLQHVKALLLGFVFGELHRTVHSPDPEVPTSEVDAIVYDQFLKWKSQKSPTQGLELDTAHIFCQWQCCLQMGYYLNELLCTPLPEPDLSRLYTGTVVHRLCQDLKTSSIVENLLSTSPRMYQLYCNLVHVVKDYLSPDVVQKKKSRSKKKAHQALKKKDATLEALPSCSINRFAPFMVED
ncbi:protein asteroid homolog 1 isoform X2 [Tiliqua scincoides]